MVKLIINNGRKNGQGTIEHNQHDLQHATNKFGDDINSDTSDYYCVGIGRANVATIGRNH